MLISVIVAFFGLLIIGVPIAHVVLGAAGIGCLMTGTTGTILAQQTVLGMNSYVMPFIYVSGKDVFILPLCYRVGKLFSDFMGFLIIDFPRLKRLYQMVCEVVSSVKSLRQCKSELNICRFIAAPERGHQHFPVRLVRVLDIVKGFF